MPVIVAWFSPAAQVSVIVRQRLGHSRNPKMSEPFSEAGLVLLDAILDDFRTMTDAPEMPVDSFHKRIAARVPKSEEPFSPPHAVHCSLC